MAQHLHLPKTNIPYAQCTCLVPNSKARACWPQSAASWAVGIRAKPLPRSHGHLRSTSALAAASPCAEQDDPLHTLGPDGLTREQHLQKQVSALLHLIHQLEQTETLQDKIATLQQHESVQRFLQDSRLGAQLLQELVSLEPEEAFVILCLPAMQQQHVLAVPPPPGNELSFVSSVGQKLLLGAAGQSTVLWTLPDGGTPFSAALRKLATTLAAVESFYDSIGGLLGYQRKCLQIMVDAIGEDCARRPPQGGTVPDAQITFHMPKGPNLASPDGRRIAAETAATGLEALPHMAEIYPLGGAGDRLGLTCSVTGEGLPVAVLPYCGRPLLESLIRDVQAREYLFFRLYGVQQVTPIVIMTSDAKGNHERVTEFMESCDWYGRGRKSFRIFKQPLVPVVSAEDGQWLLPEGLAPLLKPGGHGAIWKLMLDRGIFDWLSHHDREGAIVRQISNPMAGTDATLLSLSGSGYTDSRSFGFASCPRVVGAAEGMNVLMERRTQGPQGQWEHTYNVTNVEYTEFEKMGICDVPNAPGSQYSRFPANTNVLYVNMKAAEAAVRAGVASGGGAAMPGMIFNMKKRITYTDAASGEQRSVHAGRMECTMQNLVDSLAQRFRGPVPVEQHSELNTFVIYNVRSRVTSSAKRRREPGSLKVHQTPDGSFLDLMRNAHDLLQRCGWDVPQVPEVREYLQSGPSFIFLFHPALGPLWDVISQKVQGGSLAPQSELVLECAEAAITDLHVDGSLLVQADCVVGQEEAALSVNYSQIRSRHDIEKARSKKGAGMLSPERELSNILGAQQRQQHRAEEKTHLVYSSRCGRVRLHNVSVCNRGVDWKHLDNCYWQHQVKRMESCQVRLHGNSEFEASNVLIEGNQRFEVPDGHRMLVTTGPAGGFRTVLQPIDVVPSWQWRYTMGPRSVIQLELQEAFSANKPVSLGNVDVDFNIDYII